MQAWFCFLHLYFEIPRRLGSGERGAGFIRGALQEGAKEGIVSSVLMGAAASSEVAIPGVYDLTVITAQVGHQNERRVRMDAAEREDRSLYGECIIHTLGGIALQSPVCHHRRGRRIGDQYKAINTIH